VRRCAYSSSSPVRSTTGGGSQGNNQASESTQGAGDEAATVASRWPPGRIGEDTRRLHGQSAATQTAPKFGPRLRHHGHRGQNASGRWAGFFSAPIKIGPNRASVVRLRRAVLALNGVQFGPFVLDRGHKRGVVLSLVCVGTSSSPPAHPTHIVLPSDASP
jgi:hypothetical protein